MNFCRLLNPSYHVPGDTTVKKHLILLYKEWKNYLVQVTTGCDVSITTDLLTAVGARASLTKIGLRLDLQDHHDCYTYA